MDICSNLICSNLICSNLICSNLICSNLICSNLICSNLILFEFNSSKNGSVFFQTDDSKTNPNLTRVEQPNIHFRKGI